MSCFTVSIGLLRSLQNRAYVLNVVFLKTVLDRESSTVDVATSGSHCRSSISFSEALSAIMT